MVTVKSFHLETVRGENDWTGVPHKHLTPGETPGSATKNEETGD